MIVEGKDILKQPVGTIATVIKHAWRGEIGKVIEVFEIGRIRTYNSNNIWGQYLDGYTFELKRKLFNQV
jgi:hypothetical protein